MDREYCCYHPTLDVGMFTLTSDSILSPSSINFRTTSISTYTVVKATSVIFQEETPAPSVSSLSDVQRCRRLSHSAATLVSVASCAPSPQRRVRAKIWHRQIWNLGSRQRRRKLYNARVGKILLCCPIWVYVYKSIQVSGSSMAACKVFKAYEDTFASLS